MWYVRGGGDGGGEGSFSHLAEAGVLAVAGEAEVECVEKVAFEWLVEPVDIRLEPKVPFAEIQCKGCATDNPPKRRAVGS